MIVETGMAAIMITVLLSLVGMGVGWGTLRERVSHHSKAIETDRKENREEHHQLFQKLDEIKDEIKNGHHP